MVSKSNDNDLNIGILVIKVNFSFSLDCEKENGEKIPLSRIKKPQFFQIIDKSLRCFVIICNVNKLNRTSEPNKTFLFIGHHHQDIYQKQKVYVLVGNATRRLHIQGVLASLSRSNQLGAKVVQSSEDAAGRAVHHFRHKNWGL